MRCGGRADGGTGSGRSRSYDIESMSKLPLTYFGDMR